LRVDPPSREATARQVETRAVKTEVDS